jgi:hypothetical protein
VLSVGKKRYFPTKNNMLVQVSKIFPTVSPVCGVNPPIIWCCVGDIFFFGGGGKQKMNKSVKWLKGEKREDFEDTLIIWILQMNARNGTATDELIKGEAKVLGRQMSVTNFVHRN